MRTETMTCDGCGNEIIGLFYEVEQKVMTPIGGDTMDFIGRRNPAEYCSLGCIVKGEMVMG